jgi:hypothetical protein
VTGGKPIVVLSQSVSGVIAINPSVAFYDIHGRKREVLFFYYVPDTTPHVSFPTIIKLKKFFTMQLWDRITHGYNKRIENGKMDRIKIIYLGK